MNIITHGTINIIESVAAIFLPLPTTNFLESADIFHEAYAQIHAAVIDNIRANGVLKNIYYFILYNDIKIFLICIFYQLNII